MKKVYIIMESVYSLQKTDDNRLFIDFSEENDLFELLAFKDKDEAINRINELIAQEDTEELTEEEAMVIPTNTEYGLVVYRTAVKFNGFVTKYTVIELAIK